jgi:hypothetical protein
MEGCHVYGMVQALISKHGEVVNKRESFRPYTLHLFYLNPFKRSTITVIFIKSPIDISQVSNPPWLVMSESQKVTSSGCPNSICLAFVGTFPASAGTFKQSYLLWVRA